MLFDIIRSYWCPIGMLLVCYWCAIGVLLVLKGLGKDMDIYRYVAESPFKPETAFLLEF